MDLKFGIALLVMIIFSNSVYASNLSLMNATQDNLTAFTYASPVKKAAITLNRYIGLREVEFTINDNIPTFGGMYLNESTSTLYVYVIAEEDAEKISELLSPYKDEVTIQFLEGKYTFKEMMEWKRRLEVLFEDRTLVDSRGIRFLDIDDTKNILIVGLETLDESKTEQLKQQIQTLGVPSEAVEIVETGPIILLPKRPDYIKIILAVIAIIFTTILLGYLKLKAKGPS
ncbi:MAG TPA: hypothetical protein ENH13_04670 [Euryarchaeota archaeon]|nr:hypothetical protein BMS3Bbin16_00097 [archaeon BMS3Bbin16]HDH28406.1 hypothetical protein [Euryarchaeota archaeon]